MCGICGFNWEDKTLLREMTNILRHRGPDSGGLYTDNNLSLGHRRLSIIDLSPAGRQPMPNEDGSIFIICNGEIYNFPELRIELESKGHKFSSNTDTEVIIHGYEEWGEEIVQKLNGMFAFCIYDQNKKQLFLARDRLGIKPLYYYQNNNQFIFASEIKAILLAKVPREVNLKAAKQYLQLRYIPGEETLFKGIKKLLPGHSLTLKDNDMEINPFWDIPIPKIKKIKLAEAKNRLKELLADSVQRRLIADVPVGVYLSGGIDSAAITALASQLKEEPVKTFSVGFNSESDELSKAKEVAEHFQTDHHEIVLDENISSLLPKILWHLDMPHGDPVIIPQFKLSKLASQKVKVVLSGEGADELFAGYVQYKTFLQARTAVLFPKTITTNIAKRTPLKILDKFFDYPSSIGEKGKEKVIDFLNNIRNKEEAYSNLISILSDKDNQLLFSEEFRNVQRRSILFQESRKPLLNKLTYFDTKTWLPNYVLFINDRMTSANSIEGRVPLLDHRLVKHSTTLPVKFKLKGNTTKFILRQAMKDILPNPNIKKQAFFMPLDKWYKEELKDLAEELFTPASVKRRGYFHYYYLKRIWENYNKSKLIYGKQLFTLINFELWHRMFIDQENIPKNNDIKLSSLL